MRKILEVKGLKKSYGGRQVVDALSFAVDEGEIVGLLGPNGAGKTTAFYMVMGLIRPEGGEVHFKQEDVTYLPIHERARRGMGYLAQEPSIFKSLTVEENILCILETLPLTPQERGQRLTILLAELGLTPHAKKKAATLSGGERRRLEITRALVTHPSLLLLDEPFANVDPRTIADVKTMMRHLASRGIAILVTDHNAREIFSLVNRSYLLRDGQVALAGTVEQLLASNEARHYYLGEDFKL